MITCLFAGELIKFVMFTYFECRDYRRLLHFHRIQWQEIQQLLRWPWQRFSCYAWHFYSSGICIRSEKQSSLRGNPQLAVAVCSTSGNMRYSRYSSMHNFKSSWSLFMHVFISELSYVEEHRHMETMTKSIRSHRTDHRVHTCVCNSSKE
jgi:hypothetical protein